MKFEIQIDQNRKILSISKCYGGKTHDFKIRKKSDHVPRDVEILVDSGYQGLQKIHENTSLPFKRRQKTPLTPEQKAHNTALLSLKNSKFWDRFIEISRKSCILGSILSLEFIIYGSDNRSPGRVSSFCLIALLFLSTFAISLFLYFGIPHNRLIAKVENAISKRLAIRVCEIIKITFAIALINISHL